MRCRPVSPSVAIALMTAATLCLQSTAHANQREEVTRSFDRTVTVSGTPTLLVEHRMGDLRIRAHARNELRIQATIHVSADSRSNASLLADRIQIDVQESPGTISVTTRYPEMAIRETQRRGRNRDLSFSVDYDLLVPERLPLSLRNRFGDVAVTGMKAGGSIVNASGRVTAIDGGGRYTIENRFGRVDALSVKGGLRVFAANGLVKVSDVEGPVFLKNSFGSIEADRVRGELTAENASGSISATAVGGGAKVSTSFGPVVLREVDGRVDVTNRSGSVEAWPTVRPGTCHDVQLTTSFSPMVVHLPDSGYALAARTTFGRIQTEVPITASGTIGSNTVSGTIGRGGCALQLTNASGDIRIFRATATR
jgi:hypothetical protein